MHKHTEGKNEFKILSTEYQERDLFEQRLERGRRKLSTMIKKKQSCSFHRFSLNEAKEESNFDAKGGPGGGGSSIAKWFANLLPDPAARVRFPAFPNFSKRKF